MPLSWNEIRDRATSFAHEWSDESREDAEGKTFLDQFFDIFGVTRRRVASFETHVKKLDGKDGYIDLLWKGKLLVEQKSRGKDLTKAFKQATDYFPGLKEKELPRYILVSNFSNFELTDLETGDEHSFELAELPQKVNLFGFIVEGASSIGQSGGSSLPQGPLHQRIPTRRLSLRAISKADGTAGEPSKTAQKRKPENGLIYK